MNNKFELTSETKIFFGKTLYRIKALISFSNIEKNELGGFVEKEENLSVSGNAWVYGDARVSGDAWVYGNARVSGNAKQIMWISKVGSENGTLTAFKNKEGEIIITRGCFIGSVKEFLAAVKKRHGSSLIAKEYELCVKLVKLRLS